MVDWQRIRAAVRVTVVVGSIMALLTMTGNLLLHSFEGRPDRLGHLWESFQLMFVPSLIIGVTVGALFAVGVAILSRRDQDEASLSTVRFGMIGTIGGVLAALAYLAFAPSEAIVRLPEILATAAVFGAVGLVSGVVVSRLAKRGEWLANPEAAKRIAG